MNRPEAHFLLLICLLSIAVGCSNQSSEPKAESPSSHTIPFHRDGTLNLVRDGEVYRNLVIEVAETDSARTRGLMQREGLPQDGGMLFIFDTEEERSFWMANTPLALDIIFVDADSSIIRVAKYTRPLSQESVTSNGPAKFVFEVEAGYSDSVGILEGDRISWTLDD